MKRLAFAAILCVLFPAGAWAKDPSVTQIQKECRAIRNAMSGFSVFTFTPLEPSSEGGEVKAYRDAKGNIRLIRIDLLFATGKEIEEYYFRDGMLIFAFYEEHQYSTPGYVGSRTPREAGGKSFDSRKKTVSANRYYFKNEKLIRWVDKDRKEVDVTSKEFRDAEEEVLDASFRVRRQVGN